MANAAADRAPKDLTKAAVWEPVSMRRLDRTFSGLDSRDILDSFAAIAIHARRTQVLQFVGTTCRNTLAMINFESNVWWATSTVHTREGVTREHPPAELCTNGLPGIAFGN
jgi:hypothetical protein